MLLYSLCLLLLPEPNCLLYQYESYVVLRASFITMLRSPGHYYIILIIVNGNVVVIDIFRIALWVVRRDMQDATARRCLLRVTR
jgi:hypothetical protein